MRYQYAEFKQLAQQGLFNWRNIFTLSAHVAMMQHSYMHVKRIVNFQPKSWDYWSYCQK